MKYCIIWYWIFFTGEIFDVNNTDTNMDAFNIKFVRFFLSVFNPLCPLQAISLSPYQYRCEPVKIPRSQIRAYYSRTIIHRERSIAHVIQTVLAFHHGYRTFNLSSGCYILSPRPIRALVTFAVVCTTFILLTLLFLSWFIPSRLFFLVPSHLFYLILFW